MFLVLLMGATVTNTGSSEGCGNSWPLCHGQFIPEYAFETMVEYSHRLVTGVEGLIILGLAITAFPLRRRFPELRALLPIMIFTLLLQSGMGAWAVKYPQTPAVMATHFGISLVCFASVYLVMRVLWVEMPTSAAALRAVPPGYARLAWTTLLWSIIVAYVGAYMRHSGAELACYTWPLCNGSLIPDLSSPGVGVAWSHRLVALIAMVMVFTMLWWARSFRAQRPDLYRAAGWASALIIAQALVGATLIFTLLSLASTLAHAAFMALLFAALADTVWRATPRRRGAEAPGELAVSGTPAVAG
ncbi:MAG: heme A synthase, partial [Thermomicrobiales bacterium]|nr:heme A synthase [Thermomicrobiales bacterium]